MSWILGLLFLAVFVAYGGVCALLYKEQGRLLFPGDGAPFGPFEGLAALGGEAVSKELGGQALRYYKVPAQGGPPRAWVLLFHGNRDGASERFDFAQNLSRWGCGVLLAEFPGYAGDPVRASQKILLRNGLAMADEALSLARGLPLFHFGESLGTAVATYTAMRRPAKGLLLSTPFTSLAAVAQGRYPLVPIDRLITDPMPAWRWAPHVDCPVFIVHGTHDTVVPYAQGRAQAKNFRQAPVFVSIEGPGHSEIRDGFPDQYWGGARAFIERCLAPA
jgi:alpha-beta hydrolase superfamily lysophospholipase